jgi:uncharacterized protein (TIRG00374 family)
MAARRRTLVLQGLISLVALAAVAWWASRQRMPAFPDTGDALRAIVAALGLYALATLARGERWHRVLCLVGGRSKRADAYSLTCVGYMGNNTLPARAGDLLKVALTTRRTPLSGAEVLGAAVAERVLDAVCLGTLFLLLGGLVLTEAGLPAAHLVGALLVALALLGVAAWMLPRLEHDHPRVQQVVHFVARMLRPSRALLSPGGALLLLGTVLIWVLEASVYAAVADAVGLGLGGLDALYLVALTNLVAMVPAAPGYVGTFDAAVLFGVRALTGSSGGAAYVVALRLVLFVPITLVGLALLVARHGGLRTLRQLRPQPSSA